MILHARILKEGLLSHILEVILRFETFGNQSLDYRRQRLLSTWVLHWDIETDIYTLVFPLSFYPSLAKVFNSQRKWYRHLSFQSLLLKLSDYKSNQFLKRLIITINSSTVHSPTLFLKMATVKFHVHVCRFVLSKRIYIFLCHLFILFTGRMSCSAYWSNVLSFMY